MDVFSFRDKVVRDYESFSRSFTKVNAPDIRSYVERTYKQETFCPSPLIQLNPNFVSGGYIEEFVSSGLLHPECLNIFRAGKTADNFGKQLRLHKHQEEAIHLARAGNSFVLTTGTGSGKSLSYFIPIIDHVLRAKTQEKKSSRTTAIVIYPMNALCNSQMEELEKYLKAGYPSGSEPVTFARYTGQEKQEEREKIANQPPDILLTNFMMLELIMTRQDETDKAVVRNANGLNFLVLDELHTYRGRQGADVALLVRRIREALNPDLICLGTSATMISEGGSADRRQVVASFASRLFGAPVKSENVITETLERVTPEDVNPKGTELSKSIKAGLPTNAKYDQLRQHPLASWIEVNLGLEWDEDRWVRIREPKTLGQAIQQLSNTTGLRDDECGPFLVHFLLLAYKTRDPEGKSLCAFRLHQFIAGAGDLFSTLEPEGERFLTLNGQQYKPGDRDKVLFNVVFCRECGQEYFPIWAISDNKQVQRVERRDLRERSHDDDDMQFGFFVPDPEQRWLPEPHEEAYPEDWLELDNGVSKLKPHYRSKRPQELRLNTAGERDLQGLLGWFIPGTFRFCLNPSCRIAHDSTARSDVTKLSSLTTEGRSSATTIIALSVLRFLIEEADELPEEARKMLGFTDNRQDASLQSGHFNDFIQILLLRGALLAAIINGPSGGLTDDILTQAVFDHLWPEEERGLLDFAANPQGKGNLINDAKRAMREVLGYRLYNDLQRGWRITNPNLEQLELLKIDYAYLDDCCNDDSAWAKAHPLLSNGKPEIRRNASQLLLEVMRRNLCIKTVYLSGDFHEQMKNRSFNLLKEPWGLSEDERLQEAGVMVPSTRIARFNKKFKPVFVSYRSRFGRKLKQRSVWGNDNVNYPNKFTEDIYDLLVSDLLSALGRYGLVEVVGKNEGYRINSSALRWTLQSNVEGRHSLLRPTDNDFFRNLYQSVGQALIDQNRLLHRLEAREHTAQVDPDEREKRETDFKRATLPVLFCSPTMELGVDIAQLNTVYMRNVPPTPANYAQRSGRAGRSGQPALVVTYCAAKSPHDQYFFAQPTRMVAGSVSPPTLDLANEELVRSHLHSVWLSETHRKLENSPRDMLDLSQAKDRLPILDDFRLQMDTATVRARTEKRGRAILEMLKDELTPTLAPWFSDEWLGRTMQAAFRHFDISFDRWRSLYWATTRQMEKSHAIQMNAAASDKERKEAKQRYDEARIQQEILLRSKPSMSSDFYTYRYLASQGFLPGYNFPRLPLLAFIPARRENVGRDSFLSRPRFLGLSEFGPQSIIYHEGSQYRVRKAILSLRDEENISTGAQLPVVCARICHDCGYGHFGDQQDTERCVACAVTLNGSVLISSLYRIEHVSTRRAMRITSDEEERQRQGYDMQTTLQYARENNTLQVTRTCFDYDDREILEVHYGPAATVWRINLGWRRRKAKSIYGFNIDVGTGFWSRDEQAPDDVNDEVDSEGKTIQRIVPYVEDRRNVLVVFPKEELEQTALTTLQYVLKRGIENVFQLEESELMAEPLPSKEKRKAILFYESAEGGAGVLTRLATDMTALRRVAQKALELCHHDVEHEDDNGRPANLDDDCEAGCYKCLLSYYNQTDHECIDRKHDQIVDLLRKLMNSSGRRGTEGRTAEVHSEELWRRSGSSLEKEWLDFVTSKKLNLPDRAQLLLSEFGTQPDFAYSETQALIYIDGPHHDLNGQSRIDERVTRSLEEAGFTVIRFPKATDRWLAIICSYPEVFGKAEE